MKPELKSEEEMKPLEEEPKPDDALPDFKVKKEKVEEEVLPAADLESEEPLPKKSWTKEPKKNWTKEPKKSWTKEPKKSWTKEPKAKTRKIKKKKPSVELPPTKLSGVNSSLLLSVDDSSTPSISQSPRRSSKRKKKAQERFKNGIKGTEAKFEPGDSVVVDEALKTNNKRSKSLEPGAVLEVI